MPKNRSQSQPKQQIFAISHPHTATVGVAAASSASTSVDMEDEEVDICPTCDYECTCKPRATQTNTIAGTSSHHQQRQQPPQPLKIKLTIPSKMRVRGRISAPAKNASKKGEMTSGIAHDGEQFPPEQMGRVQSPASIPKRRGRPTKAAREAVKPTASSHSPHLDDTSSSQNVSRSRRSQEKSSVKQPSRVLSPKPRGAKPSSRRLRKCMDESFSGSEEPKNDNEDDQFPIFVSASGSSSSESDSSESSSLSDFDSDPSIQDEEEQFIMADEERSRTREKARTKRELLGDDGQRNRSPKNDWVIRPRQKSVGASDVEMDMDSEDTMDDSDDDEDEENEEDEEDETDDRQPGVAYSYTGMATGWTDDEESSIDADLFFANLTSSSDNESSSDDEVAMEDDGPPPATDGSAAHARLSAEFEVSHGWDGQLIFTSGLRTGQGILDIEFEADAARLLAESTASMSQESEVDMQTSDGADGEYEFEDDHTDGETTEEELVGADGLPTARAMMLFQLPASVSAINPLSTVSPCPSPGPSTRNRRRAESVPTAADVLSGRPFWDEPDDLEGSIYRPRSGRPLVCTGAPIMGQFDRGDEGSPTVAIINGSNLDIPSPFPRSKRRPHSRMSSLSGMSSRGRSFSRTTSLPLRGSSRSSETQQEDLMMSELSELPMEPIGLDDVLEASFLDSDASETEKPSEGDDERQHLNRWDLIPVGAFRQTREVASAILSSSAGSSVWPDPPKPDALGLDTVMLASPALWQDKEMSLKTGKRIDLDVLVSPVLLPHDGERTPTHVTSSPVTVAVSGSSESPNKTRRESRREKKMKRRSLGIVQPKHQYPHPQHHQHHYQHQHHPNMKSRSSNAVQRTGYIGPTSSVPPLNL